MSDGVSCHLVVEAARDFLARDPRFEVDTSREKFFLTTSPHGYLRRRESGSPAARPGSR